MFIDNAIGLNRGDFGRMADYNTESSCQALGLAALWCPFNNFKLPKSHASQIFGKRYV